MMEQRGGDNLGSPLAFHVSARSRAFVWLFPLSKSDFHLWYHRFMLLPLVSLRDNGMAHLHAP